MNREREHFPPDKVEAQVPDLASAHALLKAHDPDCLEVLERRCNEYRQRFAEQGPGEDFLQRARDAFMLAYARFATRHGSWGEDFHAYHNEKHTLEIFDGRMSRLCEAEGAEHLTGYEWVLLSLFAACHDIRQRETPEWVDGVGANERASIAESNRILTLAGFSPDADSSVFEDLAMMICGSTFDTSGAKRKINSTEAVTSGGALAPVMVHRLQEAHPDWQQSPELVRRVRLTLVASDLDTANVGEPFALFANSAVRLCREREMRLQRSELGAESAAPVLDFLTQGQEHYFHRLHEFDSDVGSHAFSQGKADNAPRVAAMSAQMRERFSDQASGHTGAEVIETFLKLAASAD